jgi:hypothetical protein
LGEDGKELEQLYHNNLFFDKIVSIDKGSSQLYDIYIPNTHTFIGNGIVNHNSQGCSLDFVEVDLSNIFEYGQAYTALSRVRKLEGLSILGLDFRKIKANVKAVNYYKMLNKT